MLLICMCVYVSCVSGAHENSMMHMKIVDTYDNSNQPPGCVEFK